MKYTLRAMLAVAMLVGFYVVALALAVGLVALVVEAAVLGVNAAALGKFAILAVIVAYAIVKGLFTRRKDGDDGPGGLEVGEQEQPVLWAEVRALADAVGTRVPDEIRLVPAVNAAVSEDAKLLGLVPGTRRLYVGVPLLFGLNRGEVRSVLAHELGHYSGRHTALGPVTYRGKEAIARVLAGLGPGSLVGRLLGLYGRLYYAVVHSVGRRQELEADEFSVRLAGREAAASALRGIAPLDAAWGHFVATYADLGASSERRPEDLFIGFAAMLADPATVAQMDKIRAELPEPEHSVYDTHPPLAQRLAAIEAGAEAQVDGDEAPALDLLVDVRATLDRFEQFLFAGDRRAPARWEDLAEQEGAQQVRSASLFLAANPDLAGGRPTLAGLLSRLATSGPLDLGRGGTPEEERAFLAGLIGDVAADVLVRRQAAAFRLSWDGGAVRLVGPAGTEVDPWTPARTAAESGNLGPFCGWAAAHGVDLDEVVESDAQVPGADPVPPEQDEVVGVLAPVSRGIRMRTMAVTHRGLLLTRASFAQWWGFGFRAYLGGGGEAMALRAARTPLERLRALHRTKVVEWPQIARLHVVRRRLRSSRIDLALADGSTMKLRFDNRAGHVGEPWPAIVHYLGERFSFEE